MIETTDNESATPKMSTSLFPFFCGLTLIVLKKINTKAKGKGRSTKAVSKMAAIPDTDMGNETIHSELEFQHGQQVLSFPLKIHGFLFTSSGC